MDFNDDEHISFENNKKNVIKENKTSPKKLTKPSRRVIESDDEDFSAEERNLQTKEQPKRDPTRKKPSPKKNAIAKNKPKMILGIFYF